MNFWNITIRFRDIAWLSNIKLSDITKILFPLDIIEREKEKNYLSLQKCNYFFVRESVPRKLSN